MNTDKHGYRIKRLTSPRSGPVSAAPGVRVRRARHQCPSVVKISAFV